MSLTAGAGTRCMSLLRDSPTLSQADTKMGLQIKDLSSNVLAGMGFCKVGEVSLHQHQLFLVLSLSSFFTHGGENPKGKKEIWESREMQQRRIEREDKMDLMQLPDEQKNQNIEVDVVLALKERALGVKDR